MGKPRKNGHAKKRAKDPRAIVLACIREMRAGLPPEVRAKVTADNLPERVAELVRVHTQFQQARAARLALRELGL
jgi:Flp pilus assembly protein TadB